MCIRDRQWIWEQYDHTVMGDTIQKPGGNSGVVRVHGTNKAVAASVDSSAVYCWAHPLTGGKQVVAESWRNLISVGATPIAITNCLNFGSPENEDNMGEFVECVQGIGEASKYLNFPVVSGNVSFYNQTKEVGIKPTPSIGGVGLIKDYKKMVTMDFKEKDNLVLVIGKTEGHIDQSIFARTILDEKNGPPPEVNLFNEKNNGESLLNLIDKDYIFFSKMYDHLKKEYEKNNIQTFNLTKDLQKTAKIYLGDKKLIFWKFFKDLTLFFVTVSLSISLIIWVIQAVNYLDMVSDDGHSFQIYFLYTLSVSYTHLTLPTTPYV